jgi:hypothetical protein
VSGLEPQKRGVARRAGRGSGADGGLRRGTGVFGWELRDGQGSSERLRVGCYDLTEDVTAEDLGRLAPIFSPNPSNRAEAKRRFGVDLFSAAGTELGSGQPFLRFFQSDREGRGRALGGTASKEVKA